MNRPPATPAPFAPGESWADDVEDEIQRQAARSLSPILEVGSEDSDAQETKTTTTDSDEDCPGPTPASASAHKMGKADKKGKKGGVKDATEATSDLAKGQPASQEKPPTKTATTSTSSQTPLPGIAAKAPAAPDGAQNKRSWAAVVGSHNAPASGPVLQTESKSGTLKASTPSTTTAMAGEPADPKSTSTRPPTHTSSPSSHNTSVPPSVQPSAGPSAGPSIMKGRTWAEMAAMKPPNWRTLPAPPPTLHPARAVNVVSTGTTAAVKGKKPGKGGKDTASSDLNASLQPKAGVQKPQVSTPPVAASSLVATSSAAATSSDFTTPSTITSPSAAATSSATANPSTAATPPGIGTRSNTQTPPTDSKLSATAKSFTPGDRSTAPSLPSMPSSSIDPGDWAVPVEEAFHEPSLTQPPPRGPPGFIPGTIIGYTQGVHFTIGEIPLPPGVSHQQLWDEFQKNKRSSTAREEPPNDEVVIPPSQHLQPQPYPGAKSPEATTADGTVRSLPSLPLVHAEVARVGGAMPPMPRPYSHARTVSPESAMTEASGTVYTPPPRSISPSEPSLPSPISPATFHSWEPLLAREGDRYAYFRQDGRVQTLQDRSRATLVALRMPGTLYTIHRRDQKGVVVLMGEPRLCDMQGIVGGDDGAATTSSVGQVKRDMAVQTEPGEASPRGRCEVATQTCGGQPVSRGTSPFPLPTMETSEAMVQTEHVKTKSQGTSTDPAESVSSLDLGGSRRPSVAVPSPSDAPALPAVGPWWEAPRPASPESLQNVSTTPASTAVQAEEPNTLTSLSRGDTGETPPGKKKKKKAKRRAKAKKVNKDEVPSALASSNPAPGNTNPEQCAIKDLAAKQSTTEAAAASADDGKEGKEKLQEKEKEVAPTLWARARAYSASLLFGR